VVVVVAGPFETAWLLVGLPTQVLPHDDPVRVDNQNVLEAGWGHLLSQTFRDFEDRRLPFGMTTIEKNHLILLVLVLYIVFVIGTLRS
jgi:hypothetical protein